MGIVLQYTLVYCSEKGMRKAVCITIQTGCTGRGAGQALGAGGAARALGERAQGVGARQWQARGARATTGAGRALQTGAGRARQTGARLRISQCICEIGKAVANFANHIANLAMRNFAKDFDVFVRQMNSALWFSNFAMPISQCQFRNANFAMPISQCQMVAN